MLHRASYNFSPGCCTIVVTKIKMNEQHLLERITIDPQVLNGKPVITGTRISIDYVLDVLAEGATFAEIISEHKGITQADVQACVVFAVTSLDPVGSKETAHLLRSPKNAERLFAALERAQQRRHYS